jgi:hypothetical protein
MSFSIGASVQLNELSRDLCCRLDLSRISVNKQANRDTGILQWLLLPAQLIDLSGYIQTTLGGNLFPTFGHQGDIVGFDIQGDRNHFVGGRHFQIEMGSYRLPQEPHITILDVPTVFPQMNGNAIGTAKFC